MAASDLPAVTKVFHERALYLALEATFSYGFWTVISAKDYSVPVLQPLNVDSLEYVRKTSEFRTLVNF